MLKEHPALRSLIGRNPYTFLFILFLVTWQIGLASLLRDQAWWLCLLCAYGIGAFANHGLYVLIHECAHNLVFSSKRLNLLAAIFADLPNTVPGAISFRRYHLKHHASQGDHEGDADLPSYWEARLIGNSMLRKTLWLILFPFFQALRPPRIRQIKIISKWTMINMIIVLSFDLFVYFYIGPMAYLYLLLSLFFSIGLHPLGARWIQEHYLVDPPQETYSYYGPLNVLAFNVGYHNEHHDLPSVPWNRLPHIRKLAPAWYNSLTYHTSWTKLLIKFIRDGDLSLFSRALRQ